MPQNNTETVTLKTAHGELVDVIGPAGMTDDQIRTLARSKMPEEFAPESFSQQDIQDLIDIRRKLAPGDPRADKLDRLLLQTIPQQKYPGTFSGAMQAFSAAESREQLMQSSSNPANVPERAMQQTMGGPPMFVDVPAGQKQSFEQAGKAGYQTGGKIGAGLVAGAGVGAGIGGALSAPTIAGTETAGTGILDAARNEIMREVTKYGPSLGRQALQSTLGWVSRHKLLSAAVYEGARQAGVPLPNVMGWLARAAGEGK